MLLSSVGNCSYATLTLFFTAADRGTCTLPGECNCNQGYSGMLCQNDDDVCGHTSPCANGATCDNNGVNEYLCTCPVGYTSVNCDVEIDGCDPSGSSPPCENGGTCTVSQLITKL